MKDINFIIILFFLYIILIITAASLGDSVNMNNQLGKLFHKENNINLTNGNLSFDETFRYSTKLVKDNYNYTIRFWENESTNVSDIILNGGDCSEYAYLYKELFEENGHYAQVIEMFTEESEGGHAFALVWNREIDKYCILDQIDSTCFKVGGINK